VRAVRDIFGRDFDDLMIKRGAHKLVPFLKKIFLDWNKTLKISVRNAVN
jgi:hypothetical protein